MDDLDPWRARCALVAISASVALGAAPAAQGATPPTGGAVARPAQLTLRAPFPCGTAIRISCGYGPGCSSFHKNTSSKSSSNDHYALDLVRDESGGGKDKPITPVAKGRVVYAAWATGGWASYGQIVLVEHDVGDGHAYVSLYAHLHRISASVGQQVTVADAIGTMGGSANNQLAGFATHLHFALYRDAKHDGGPYGGAAVVPEPLSGLEGLAAGKKLTVQCDPEPPAPPTEPPARRDAGAPPDRSPPAAWPPDAATSDGGGAIRTADAGREPAPGQGDGPARPALTDTLYGGCSVGGPTARALSWLAALALLAAARGAARRRARRRRPAVADRRR